MLRLYKLRCGFTTVRRGATRSMAKATMCLLVLQQQGSAGKTWKGHRSPFLGDHCASPIGRCTGQQAPLTPV